MQEGESSLARRDQASTLVRDALRAFLEVAETDALGLRLACRDARDGTTVMEMRRVAVVFRRPSTFIDRDAEILKRHFDVATLVWRHTTGALPLYRLAARSDIVLSWFAGPYAALATYYGRLFGTKTALMVGGYETARIPEIGYGAFLNPVTASLVRIAVARSDGVAVVDPSLAAGLRTLCPTDREIAVIPTGYDPKFFRPAGPKESMVVTVAAIGEQTAQLKGLYVFAEAARRMKEMRFVIVGKVINQSVVDRLRELSSGRVEVAGQLDPNGLVRYFQRAKVYCQLSRHEGLPNALCEAMLCKCVPIGTRHGGIPTAIGDTGLYVNYGDIPATINAIRTAATMDGSQARRRIMNLFPIEMRERRLVDFLNRLV